MSSSVASNRAIAELQSVSGRGHTAKAALQKLSCPVQLLVFALNRAGISQKEAAITMGVSESLLSRQLDPDRDEHPSWKRLWRLPDSFFVELLLLLVESRLQQQAEAVTTITVRRTA